MTPGPVLSAEALPQQILYTDHASPEGQQYPTQQPGLATVPIGTPAGDRPSVEIDRSRDRAALSGHASQEQTYQHAHFGAHVSVAPKIVASRCGNASRSHGDGRTAASRAPPAALSGIALRRALGGGCAALDSYCAAEELGNVHLEEVAAPEVPVGKGGDAQTRSHAGCMGSRSTRAGGRAARARRSRRGVRPTCAMIRTLAERSWRERPVSAESRPLPPSTR